MKNIMIFLLFVTPMLFAFVQKDEIAGAFEKGDAQKLALYFDQSVDITLPSKSNTYNKIKAETVMKDFFAANKVRSFEILHSSSNPSSNFFVGKLITTGGTFRTTVNMRMRENKQLIQGIEIEAL